MKLPKRPRSTHLPNKNLEPRNAKEAEHVKKRPLMILKIMTRSKRTALLNLNV